MFKSNSGSASVMIDSHDVTLRNQFAVRGNARLAEALNVASYALLGFAVALPIVALFWVLA